MQVLKHKREERELLSSYHTRLKPLFKGTHSGNSKKESEVKRAKEDRQQTFDLI